MLVECVRGVGGVCEVLVECVRGVGGVCERCWWSV